MVLLSKWWPNVTKTCQEIGISTSTYYNHLRSDTSFASKVAQIRLARLNKIESIAFESAEDMRHGFLDRAMVLRAHMPELYNPAKVIRVEGVKLGAGEAQGRAKLAQEAIEGELVGTYKRRKAKQRLKLSGGGEGTAGGGAG